ncbi:MAG TPA: TonB-dependent receptor [Candidatus Elarobacter sp.]
MDRTRLAFAAFAATGAVLFASLTPALADVVGIVRGTLVGAHNEPLPNIVVKLVGDRGTLTATTAKDGTFAFARVPFGHYALQATGPAGTAGTQIDVASDAVVDVNLIAAPVIGRSAATTTSVRGTPVSENAYGARRLAALPRNDNLNAVVEQAPGVVTFSYGEPVAHGFHGLTYELDGAPLPQSTSSNFAQLVDPRNLQAVEVFTGAFPAEYGGSRQGAVVNVVSGSTADAAKGGALTLGGGILGQSNASLLQHFTAGKAQLSLALNGSRSDRGLDAPSIDSQHDATSSSDQFLRIALPLNERNLLTADLSNSFSTFQIPINTDPNNPNSPYVAPVGTDDVQNEYDRFASLSFTHTTADGSGYLRVVPWLRWNRIAYLGDLNSDVNSFVVNSDGSTSPQNGLQEDRSATYTGLRLSAYHATEHHAIKGGVDLSQETFHSNSLIRIAGTPDFIDNTAQRGSQLGAYIEDKWTPTRTLALNAGVRWDRSTGYVSGGQLSPRVEINDEIGHGTVLHAYYGRLYAAPSLEDTRRDAVVTQTSASATPVYDLKPERDTYVEVGLARTFAPGFRGYLNAFDRTAVNVLDTTQLANTPLFAVFNNSIGVARGIEMRLDASSPTTDAGVSATWSRALAGGISGSTFLFPPDQVSDITLNPEDHDQTWEGNAFFTRRFGAGLLSFATVQAEYGTGFPVQFQSGNGRLPAHWLGNIAIGRQPDRVHRTLGYQLALDNVFDHRFLYKVNNGFNTTQWNAPRSIVFRVTEPW